MLFWHEENAKMFDTVMVDEYEYKTLYFKKLPYVDICVGSLPSRHILGVSHQVIYQLSHSKQPEGTWHIFQANEMLYSFFFN